MRNEKGVRSQTPNGGEETLTVREMWQAMRPLIEPRHGLITVGFFSLVAGICQAGMLILLGQIAIDVTTGESSDLGPFVNPDSSVLLGAAFVSAILMTASGTVATYKSTRLGTNAYSAVRTRLTRAFLRSSWAVRSRERSGRLQELLSTHANNAATAVLATAASFASVLICASLLTAALVVDPVSTLVISVAGALLTLVFRPINHKLRRASRQQMQRNVQYATSISETVSLSQDLMVFGVRTEYEQRLSSLLEGVSTSYMQARFLQRVIPEWFRNGVFLLILGGLALVVASGTTKVASLTIVILLLLRAVTYAREITVVYTRLHELVPYIEQLEETAQLYEGDSLTEAGLQLGPFERLQLESVSYTYPQADKTSVRNLNLTIERGETLGIVGPSGSGKSTSLQLLLRLRNPDDGRLVINDIDADLYSLDSYTQRIALVAQDLVLFEGSIAENIRFFRPAISDEDLELAAVRAHIHDEIVEMSDGYRTQLSGLSGGISGGQRQRICIARALAGSPDVILLDEPTSALDAKSETALRATLAELAGHTTLIIISHRISTLTTCNRVAVLDNGTFTDVGTPEELRESNEFYRDAVAVGRGL